jgi:hypothetical protein
MYVGYCLGWGGEYSNFQVSNFLTGKSKFTPQGRGISANVLWGEKKRGKRKRIEMWKKNKERKKKKRNRK